MNITPKNWATFQHYKDRAPAWIKLHRGLLDNIDYFKLSAEAGKALPLIWLLASERDGIVPEASEVAFRLRLSDELAADILSELIEREFLVSSDGAKTAEQDATQAQRIAKNNGFGSRHVSDEVKREVWERDGAKCCSCGSSKNIEYDHKHPVSKGGNSESDNIQLLCRPCNRAKRVSLATPAQPLRSLEKRREEDIEKRKRKREAREIALSAEGDFELFWKIWPNKTAKPIALKAFRSALRRAPVFAIMTGAENYIRDKPPDRQWLNPATFLNQNRWEDQPAKVQNGKTSNVIQAADNLVSILDAFNRGAEPEAHPVCSHESAAVVRFLPKGGG